VDGSGAGNDNIKSGKGDDINTGGAGADNFKCGKGTDTVIDFNANDGDKAHKSCENVS
jgi:Ca2+-binding RTX toxin-like protein